MAEQSACVGMESGGKWYVSKPSPGKGYVYLYPDGRWHADWDCDIRNFGGWFPSEQEARRALTEREASERAEVKPFAGSISMGGTELSQAWYVIRDQDPDPYLLNDGTWNCKAMPLGDAHGYWDSEEGASLALARFLADVPKAEKAGADKDFEPDGKRPNVEAAKKEKQEQPKDMSEIVTVGAKIAGCVEAIVDSRLKEKAEGMFEESAKRWVGELAASAVAEEIEKLSLMTEDSVEAAIDDRDFLTENDVESMIEKAVQDFEVDADSVSGLEEAIDDRVKDAVSDRLKEDGISVDDVDGLEDAIHTAIDSRIGSLRGDLDFQIDATQVANLDAAIGAQVQKALVNSGQRAQPGLLDLGGLLGSAQARALVKGLVREALAEMLDRSLAGDAPEPKAAAPKPAGPNPPAPVAPPKPATPEVKAPIKAHELVGEWEKVGDAAQILGGALYFKADSCGHSPSCDWALTLDETNKRFEIGSKRGAFPKVTHRGSYELKGDDLTVWLCYVGYMGLGNAYPSENCHFEKHVCRRKGAKPKEAKSPMEGKWQKGPNATLTIGEGKAVYVTSGYTTEYDVVLSGKNRFSLRATKATHSRAYEGVFDVDGDLLFLTYIHGTDGTLLPAAPPRSGVASGFVNERWDRMK